MQQTLRNLPMHRELAKLSRNGERSFSSKKRCTVSAVASKVRPAAAVSGRWPPLRATGRAKTQWLASTRIRRSTQWLRRTLAVMMLVRLTNAARLNLEAAVSSERWLRSTRRESTRADSRH
jgi:hypothetical protein